MLIENRLGFTLVLLMILSIIFFYKLSICSDDNFLSKSKTDGLRGFAITCIIYHHIVQRIANPGILVPFKGVGYLFVSIFFFISGYGLVKSFIKKENYLDGFIKKRLLKIYKPFLIVNFVHLLINIFIIGHRYTIIDFIFKLTGIKLMTGSMWYLITIIFWYFIFYFIFRSNKLNNTFIKFMSISIIYFIFSYYIGLSKNWYDTSFIFPLGVFFGIYENKIKDYIKLKYIKILTLSSIIFIIGFLLNFGKEDLGSIIIRSFTSVAFTIMFLMITMKLNIANNKYSIFIGSISFELYLIHDRILDFLNIGGSVTLINLMIYIVVLIALSMILKKVTNGISTINMRIKKDVKE